MTTAPTVDRDALVHVTEMPGTRAARAHLSKIISEQTAIGARLSRFRTALNPRFAEDAHITAEMVMEARVHGPEVEREFARVSLAASEAEIALAVARDADRVELLDRFERRKRPLVAKLAAILEEARPINEELSALEVAEHEMTGHYLDALSWPQLTHSTPSRETFLDTWLTNAKERGLLT